MSEKESRDVDIYGSKKITYGRGNRMASAIYSAREQSMDFLTRDGSISIDNSKLNNTVTLQEASVETILVDAPKLDRSNSLYEESSPEPLSLTSRQVEVLSLASQGLTNNEIASRLLISIHSVKNILYQAFIRLGVERRTEAVVKAAKHGLITLNGLRQETL